MRYLCLRVLKEVQKDIVGRLSILVEDVDVLRLDELANIHPAGSGRVALYRDLATHILIWICTKLLVKY
jgi:hypothetical protein